MFELLLGVDSFSLFVGGLVIYGTAVLTKRGELKSYRFVIGEALMALSLILMMQAVLTTKGIIFLYGTLCFIGGSLSFVKAVWQAR